MQIAICDDNAIERELFFDILAAFFDSKSLSSKIEQYSSGIELLCDVEEGKWYDIIFMDIFMDKMLGIDVARNLRKIGYDGKIIFQTVSADFAIESYEVEASAYILKPYDVKKLTNIVNRVVKNIDNDFYTIKQRSNYVRIPYSEIIYVESKNSKCILHRTDGRCYTVYKRLDEIEGELAVDPRFLRCHQSYLVNMDYILQVDKQFRLSTGDSVMIRQRDIKAIRDKYSDFLISKKKRNIILQ